MLLVSDLSGRMRGKSVPLLGSERLLEEGLGWIPANAVLTCFGPMAKVENDALGELRLIPAENEPTTFSHDGLKIDQNWWIGKIVRMDGFPWECCYMRDAPGALLAGLSKDSHGNPRVRGPVGSPAEIRLGRFPKDSHGNPPQCVARCPPGGGIREDSHGNPPRCGEAWCPRCKDSSRIPMGILTWVTRSVPPAGI